MVTTTIPVNEKTEILKARVVKGNEYCNGLWQKIKKTESEEEYQKLFEQLDLYAEKLRGLVYMLNLSGYSGCCFGDCKWDEDNYICFGCTKGN